MIIAGRLPATVFDGSAPRAPAGGAHGDTSAGGDAGAPGAAPPEPAAAAGVFTGSDRSSDCGPGRGPSAIGGGVVTGASTRCRDASTFAVSPFTRVGSGTGVAGAGVAGVAGTAGIGAECGGIVGG